MMRPFSRTIIAFAFRTVERRWAITKTVLPSIRASIPFSICFSVLVSIELVASSRISTGDGANLSQGQRQLLSIARAAVADPPVLILDEATSSIDTRTEKQIEKGMDALMEGRTVFVIAHRLSTVRNANAIMVLENGRIIERGDHDDLIEQKGKYYQLYTGSFAEN